MREATGSQRRRKSLLRIVCLIAVLAAGTCAFGQAAESGEEPIEKADVARVLESSRTLFICSRTKDFPADSLAAQLLKRREFKETGFMLVRQRHAADLIVEVDRQFFTFDFTFVVYHAQSSIVVTSGKEIAIDGIRAAGGIAKQLAKGLQAAMAAAPPEEKSNREERTKNNSDGSRS